MMWYPLTFGPIFKPRIWGGRRLEELFGKPLPAGVTIGESWELSGLSGDESIVATGPAALAGQKLTDLAAQFSNELLGRPLLPGAAFPLLVKLLDARQPLSVQVHPSKATIARAAAGSASSAQPKNECWYIIDAEPGARIWTGLNDGVDRVQFAAAAAAGAAGGNVADLLRAWPVRPGDFFYLPGGTVHALGGGIVVAEVQTPSDTTYRVFDWNRVDPATGQPRAMHLAEALDAIDYGSVTHNLSGSCATGGLSASAALADKPPVAHIKSPVTEHYAASSPPPASAARGDTVRLLGCPPCDDFVIDKRRLGGGARGVKTHAVGGRGTMIVWLVLRGTGCIECKPPGPATDFSPGRLILFPAAMGPATARVDSVGDCELLEISLPT